VNRREFVSYSSALACLTTGLHLDAEASLGEQKAATNSAGNTGGLNLLKTPYSSSEALLNYTTGVESAAPGPPNTILYYDKGKKTFLSPATLQATQKPGNYSINSTLRAFNLASDRFETAKRSKQEVQIGLNFSAPISSVGDNFAWILKNAVNIFLGKSTNVGSALATFKSTTNAQPASPSISNKAQVLQGTFSLQANAFFQKQEGLWRKLFQALSGVPGSPLLATLGIPGIALSALEFVTFSLSKLTKDEPLTPIWDAKPLPFALTSDKNDKADFKFQPGLWCIVDSQVSKESQFLKGHTIDIENESYQIMDSTGNPLKATYVVSQFDVDALQ
jgi:hypothetical protein